MGEDRFVDEGEGEDEGGMGRKGMEFLVEGWKKEGKWERSEIGKQNLM